MLSCSEFLAEFGDYLDNVADSSLRTHLELHLHECKTCRVIVDSTRKTIQIVTESDSFSFPAEGVESMVQHVMSRVRQRT